MSRLLLCRLALRSTATHVRPPSVCRARVARRWQSTAATQTERIPQQRRHGDSTLTVAQRNRIHNAHLLRYVEAYRQHGHKRARISPLDLTPVPDVPELEPTTYGLHPDARYDVSGILGLPSASTHATGEHLQRHLEHTYCSSIAAEFSHLRSAAQRDFLASRLESVTPRASLSPADRRNIHSLLLQSATFDRFMTIKFPATKRYGLEGAEALLPALDAIFASASQQGVQQTVLGMPHRGRLNVLVALLDFPARALFSKVAGRSWVPAGMKGDCDVLSHASTTVSKKFAHQQHSLKVSLLPNPSHLEAINPVAQGRVRAEQQLLAGREQQLSLEESRQAVMCLQIHGDAAFSGQGVVAEALTLANLPDFTVGGTVHVICNNQVGFTAGREKGRSSLYASDMAAVINCPVLHVNAEDVEAVVYASKLAVDYRSTFHEDIVLDIVGYRKLGHNEVDEPRFTQPAMYKQISDRRSVVDVYGEQLESQGLLRKETSERLVTRLMAHLEAELAASKNYEPSADAYFQNEWAGFRQADHNYDHANTGVDVAVLKEAALASVALPSSFQVHPRLLRSHVEARRSAVSAGGATIDWATAEAMAIGTLLRDGYDVRMCGQDVERGTFSHRHAVLHDQNTSASHTPFHHAGYSGHAQFVSSNLSECGVLGFEYGYNITSPNTLNIWEAQYGDFANTAQPIIDNFIASGETKWLKSTGLVLLLPHGSDPTGPDHVTCRLERFLQLSDDDPTHSSHSAAPLQPVNLLVANPSTPAQYFHLLRRQMQRHYRKPLVIAAPKVLLRHSACVSRLDDMERGRTFMSVLGDELMAGREKDVDVLVLCSGKVYYDLTEERSKRGRSNIAFVRLEELSPYPWLDVQQQLVAYSAGGLRRVMWVQEEPRNAGAWSYVSERLQRQVDELPGVEEKVLRYVGRRPMASAATGSTDAHKQEVKQLFDAVFG